MIVSRPALCRFNGFSAFALCLMVVCPTSIQAQEVAGGASSASSLQSAARINATRNSINDTVSALLNERYSGGVAARSKVQQEETSVAVTPSSSHYVPPYLVSADQASASVEPLPKAEADLRTALAAEPVAVPTVTEKVDLPVPAAAPIVEPTPIPPAALALVVPPSYNDRPQAEAPASLSGTQAQPEATVSPVAASTLKAKTGDAGSQVLLPPMKPAELTAKLDADPTIALKQNEADKPKLKIDIAKDDMALAPPAIHLGDEGDIGREDAEYLRKIAGSEALLVPDGATSDAQTYGEPVALADSVIFALKNNYEVLAGEEKLRSAWWDKVGAYSEYAPSVGVSYSQGAERSAPASVNDALGNRMLDNTHFRRDRGMTVQQPLIDLGILADIFSAQDKEDIAKAEHKDQREGIAADTVNIYLKLLQSRVAIALAEQYKQYLDNLLARMTERVQGGGATAADLDRIRSRATVAETARIEGRGEYQSNLSEYRRLTKIAPSQLLIPPTLAPAIPVDSQEALAAAVRNNPVYQNALAKIDMATDDRNKAYASLLPKLSVQYNHSYSYDAGGAAKGNPVDGVYANQTTDSVMLVAQWALSGGTAIASTQSGAAKEREMGFRARDSRARLEQSIQSGYTAINSARERRQVLVRSVEENERVVKGFEEQYAAGGRSLFDLLDAYEQLYSSRLNLMRVVVAGAMARYQVHKQMGGLVAAVAGTKGGK